MIIKFNGEEENHIKFTEGERMMEELNQECLKELNKKPLPNQAQELKEGDINLFPQHQKGELSTGILAAQRKALESQEERIQALETSINVLERDKAFYKKALIDYKKEVATKLEELHSILSDVHMEEYVEEIMEELK